MLIFNACMQLTARCCGQSRAQDVGHREAQQAAWEGQCRADALKDAEARRAELDAREADMRTAEANLAERQADQEVLTLADCSINIGI